MSIKAYVGRMGSGKSYEVVSVVILGALRTGRRVVSNIAGLDYPAMVDLLVDEGTPPDNIGQLVHVEHDAVREPNFWRTDKDSELGIGSFIHPGDVVALDEVWRFWSGFAAKGDDGAKRPERVMNFFRMHRHFTHPDTGFACDVALITQDVMDLSRQVRAVVEETYQMTKLTAIGSSKRYRVDVYQGSRLSRSSLRQLQRTYEDRYFPLYSSHSQKQVGSADAKEVNIDGRGNILKGAIFKLVLPIAILVGIGAVWLVMGFFKGEQKPVTEAEKSVDGAAAVVSTSGGAVVPPDAEKTKSDVSDNWRVVGWFSNKAGEMAVIVQDKNGRSRTVYDPPAFKVHGWQLSVKLPEGDMATMYSGGLPEKNIVGGNL